MKFTWVGGRPSVDFTATVGKRRLEEEFERLPAPKDLARWFREAKLSTVAVSRRDYTHALELREALYRLFTGTTLRPDLELVNQWSARPLPGPKLTATLKLEHPKTDADGLLSLLARDAVDLLAGPLAGRIRTCASDDCSLLFVDESRAGRRRWCSMNTCGARSKMKQYRASMD